MNSGRSGRGPIRLISPCRTFNNCGNSSRWLTRRLSHRALLADLEHVGRIEPSPTSPDDVVLLVLPLSHVFGLSTGLGMVARAGATGVLVDRFQPGRRRRWCVSTA